MELVEKRFEEINRRFEDMKYYLDIRIGFLEKLIIALNVPVLAAIIGILVKLLLAPP